MTAEPSGAAGTALATALVTARENRRVALALARSLCREQGTHVVVSPGSRSTPLALAFDALPEATVHVVVDGRAAAFVALGIARATGEPAIAVATSGSAGAHYFPAVVEASQGRVPLLLVTANRPGELADVGAPQTMPQHALFGEHARASLSLPEPHPGVTDRHVKNLGARARAVALGSPPGPVHLDVPFREPLWTPELEAEPPPPAVPRARVVSGKRQLDAAALDALARELALEERGLFVAGPLAPATLDRDAFATAMARLARALGWPVLADPLSGLRHGGHDRTLVVAAGDALLAVPGLGSAMRPSRVLAFGQLMTSKAAGAFLATFAEDRTTLVDADGQWRDGGGVASELFVAEPSAFCEALAARVEELRGSQRARSEPPHGGPQGATTEAWLEAEARVERPHGDPQAAYTAAWLKADARAEAALDGACERGDFEGRAARELARALPDGACLFVGSSMPIRHIDRFVAKGAQRLALAGNRGVNGIDGAVATALGMALARRAPTLALVGDLTFLHDLDGCEAAGTLGARLTVVVFDNGGGAIFERLPIAEHPTAFERLFRTPRPAKLGAVAAALGMRHVRVARVDDLVPTVLAELERPGVRVVELTVDSKASRAASEAALARVAAAVRDLMP